MREEYTSRGCKLATMSFTIRLATQADSLSAATIVKAVFDEYGFTWDEADYCADLYDLKGHYLELGHPFWVAEFGGEIVGTSALELYDTLPGSIGQPIELKGKIRAASSDCSLERLYVHPKARGLGLGTALLRRTIDEAVSRGRKAMEIWSDKKLENAHRLYGHFGVTPIGDRICDDPDESPEWGFVLGLSG